jgi:hypothetical protein
MGTVREAEERVVPDFVGCKEPVEDECRVQHPDANLHKGNKVKQVGDKEKSMLGSPS